MYIHVTKSIQSQEIVTIMSSYSEERETELLEHRSDLITAAQVELNMMTPKHKIVAAEGRANGGRIKKDLLHQQGGRVQGRKQKTRRAKRQTGCSS